MTHVRYIAWVHTAPESNDPKIKAQASGGRSRAEDITDVLGEIPMPSSAQYHPLVTALFEVGPLVMDEYVTWQELEAWQRVTGVSLDPWEASAIVDMSKAYLRQKRESTSIACLCPWPKGQNIWRYVLDKKHQQQQEKQKEKEPDGNRKRHRNPPSR